MSPELEAKLKAYPETEMFKVIDTIGVPHPFTITHHHIVHANKRNSIYLGEEVISDLEKETKKPSCGMEGCNLMFNQHEQALVVRCRTKDKKQTQEYLESIVKQCESDGFAGFVLLDGTNE